MASEEKIYVRGGLKDIAQSLWYIQNNPSKEYLVHTHNPDVEQLFNFYNCKNTHYYFYEDEKSHDETVEEMIRDHASENQENISDISKSFYSAFQFGFAQEEIASSIVDSFPENKPVVGIHPFVSQFSSKIYKSFGIPDITMPHDLLEEIISEDFNYLIFGNKEELKKVNIDKDNVTLAYNEDLLTVINLVKFCDKFIGTFSSFKTISSSQQIKTFCIMPLRAVHKGLESYFIDQYVSDGVMRVYRIEDYELEKEALKAQIDEFLEDLR